MENVRYFNKKVMLKLIRQYKYSNPKHKIFY